MQTGFQHCVVAACAVLALAAAPMPAAGQEAEAEEAGTGDPKALEVAEQLMDAMGGRANWDGTQFIKFRFIRGEFDVTLTWDKWTGRYRLDATTEDGQPYVVLMNIETREGTAYVDGRALAGEENDALVRRAAGIWKGETYWFLMPYKLRDPGVVLRHEGEETADGATYDVVHVSFDGPDMRADQFWAYVNQETHLMDKFRYRLAQGAEGEFWWRNWERHGSLLLSALRENAAGATIRMEEIVATNTMPDEVFTTP